MSKPAAAAASASALPPLTRWDHLWMEARKAAEDGGESERETYVSLFQSHVRRTLSGLTRTEYNLLEADANLDWEMRAFDHNSDSRRAIADLYSHLNYDARTGKYIPLEDTDAETHPEIVHMLRRLRAFCPAGWMAFVKWVEVEVKCTDEQVIEANDYYNDMVCDGDEGDGMELRASSFETILHDTFTRAEIDDPTAPPPARFAIKRKLEHLASRVAALAPAQAVAELRDILGEVEEALPEDERTPAKKART